MTMLGIIAGVVVIVFSLVIVVLTAGIAINLFTRVPYAACPHGQVTRIFAALRLPPQTRVYDLGAGDGRVVFAAAARGLCATGFELQPISYLRAKIVQLFRYPTADIRYGDFQRAHITDAGLVFCFLVGAVMPKMAAFLDRQLQPGCTVVSYGFPLPGWQPTHVLQSDHPGGSQIFFYRVSAAPQT